MSPRRAPAPARDRERAGRRPRSEERRDRRTREIGSPSSWGLTLDVMCFELEALRNRSSALNSKQEIRNRSKWYSRAMSDTPRPLDAAQLGAYFALMEVA